MACETPPPASLPPWPTRSRAQDVQIGVGRLSTHCSAVMPASRADRRSTGSACWCPGRRGSRCPGDPGPRGASWVVLGKGGGARFDRGGRLPDATLWLAIDRIKAARVGSPSSPSIGGPHDWGSPRWLLRHVVGGRPRAECSGAGRSVNPSPTLGRRNLRGSLGKTGERRGASHLDLPSSSGSTSSSQRRSRGPRLVLGARGRLFEDRGLHEERRVGAEGERHGVAGRASMAKRSSPRNGG